MAELKLYKTVLGAVQTNVYYLKNTDTDEVIIVDPADEAEEIFSNLTDIGAKPVAIYLTHGHYDHILAAKAVKERYGIPVIAHEDEVPVLTNARYNMSAFYGLDYTLEPDITVKDGDILEYAGFSCKVLHTPGHTWGCCCYYFEEQKLLISGDTLFQFSYGRTDFETSDGKEMAKSIKRLLSELPDDVTACPGHMGYTTIETEKRYNPLA